jgi:hypothetical protein
MGRRWVVERVIVPAWRALQQPREQLWLGIALATLLAVVFGPTGCNPTGHSNPTAGGATAPGSYQRPQPPFAMMGGTPQKPQVHPPSRSLDQGQLPDEPPPVEKDEFGVIH